MARPVYLFRDLAGLLGGELHGNPGNGHIAELLTDSRKLSTPLETAFFALVTTRNDGHRYIGDLYERGVRHFVVSYIPEGNFSDAAFLTVSDTLRALQRLAAHHRSLSTCPVTAITGSNGKTIVKEWLWQLLSPEHVIVRSPKSYNSQTGVPLSVWQMNPLHTLAIFEAGISEPGEMEHLEPIIKPGTGIFTNIGQAHDRFFRSRSEKINEKLKLFIHCEKLIFCSDHEEIRQAIANNPNIKATLYDWGFNPSARLRITETRVKRSSTLIKAIMGGVEREIAIPFTDEASFENAMHCWVFMLMMGYGPDVTAGRMLRLQPVAMRLEMKEGINGCAVINDTYSSDPESLAIALDFLAQQDKHEKRTLILSDMLQISGDEEERYREIAGLLSNKNIQRFIGIGPALSKYCSFFSMSSEFYPGTAEFLARFSTTAFRDETILLKGARVFEFERINERLQQRSHETVLEVNLNALVHNLNYYRSKLQPGVKLMAMVKAFSYGSGSYEIANTLEWHRADYLAVAYADEGVALRRAGISLPILVMNPEDNGMDAILRFNLEPEIYNFRTLEMLAGALRNNGNGYKLPAGIHLKFDTGMHRLGFEPADIPELAQRLLTMPTITVQSAFSHLVASEDPGMDAFTRKQIDCFSRMAAELQQLLGYGFIRHILNSAGIVRFPEARFEMVRLGISLYGVSSDPLEQKQLETVSSLKTSVSQIKTIKKGDTVGYNRRWTAVRDSVIATIPVGYADGLSRRLSNGRGKMMLNGEIVPVAGNICMDMTMLDITGVPASEGDEVIVFGPGMPISNLASAMDTIPYEVLTGISGRVKRVYFQE
jgi:alanine racemase